MNTKPSALPNTVAAAITAATTASITAPITASMTATHGGAPRPTLLLLHASGSSRRQWDALAESLRNRFDVRAIDLHGHGKQPAPDHGQPLSVHDDVVLARAVLEASGGGHVIGHSYGAAVALHLAASAPGLVHSLAVYEPVVFRLLADHAAGSPGSREVFEVATGIWEQVRLSNLADAAALFVDYWSGQGTWQAMPAEHQQTVAARMPLINQQFHTLMHTPLSTAALAQLDMPLLCLHGTRSTCSARQMAMLLESLLPQARHEALEGLGHMAPVTHALGVNHRLVRFMNVERPGWHMPADRAA